ncbi:hypothetical protein PLICRDRAFT_234958 [Plicaturopsis crispa FD-325 SS-3]|nr:hypothetical protein PLICRDRAFT_234958 [Plicaturopsis crispa FD-325 SS-3]
MNVRPDAMLRHQGMPPLSQNMLTMNSQQFMQSQQNHPQTQQFSPSHMNGLVPIPSANPPMALIAGQPQAITPAQRYQLQLNQATDRKRQQVLLQQAQAAQGLNPSGGGGGAPGQGPMQNMAFPSTMMPQQPGNPQLRRVASQPTPLNQSGAIHPGQGGGMSMGMNPQTSMPAHLRQAHQQQQHLQQQQQQQQHQQQQLRMQQQQQQQMQGHMPPDMAIALGHRQPMPLNMNRSASAQAHLVATMPQNNFQNPMSLVQQQAPSSSPRPGGSHSQPHTPSNIMTTPVPGHGSAGRPQMTPDNPMFMNFQNQQNQLQNYNANRMPSGNNPQFFVPSSVSPNNPIDGLSSLPDGMGNGGRQNFLSTPAQQMEQMRQGNEGFAPHYGMPPPHSNAPPRPPSHNTQHPPAPLGSQPQQPHQHHSPHSSEHGIGHHRPPSQPQGQPVRPSSQAGLSLTPRGMHAQLPGNGSLLPAARIPGPASSQHPGSHIIPPSAPNHSVPVAPRPPTQPQPVAGPSTAPAHSMPTPQSEIAANHAALLAQQRPGV